MFDIGFAELLVIAVIALLVLGPERMPEAVRSTSAFLRKIKSSFNHIKTEIEREVGVDDIKREIHNEAILKQLNEDQHKATENLDEIRNDLNNLEFDINNTSNPKEPT